MNLADWQRYQTYIDNLQAPPEVLNQLKQMTVPEDINMLQACVSRFVNIAGGNVLNEKQKKMVSEQLSDFVVRGTFKYVNGQREHGGELSERNCLHEAKQENIDSWFYLMQAQNKINELHAEIETLKKKS